jgi:hypothetical protein
VNFNEEELLKIEKATSGIFKKKARTFISNALSSLRPYVKEAMTKEEPERKEMLKALVTQATGLRQEAVRQGAKSGGHPEWAAAAACESWLHELLLGNNESISRVEKIIGRLEQR